jgi:hypothetical protein
MDGKLFVVLFNLQEEDLPMEVDDLSTKTMPTTVMASSARNAAHQAIEYRVDRGQITDEDTLQIVVLGVSGRTVNKFDARKEGYNLHEA